MVMKGLTTTVLVIMVLSFVEAKCPTFFENFNMACYYFGNNRVVSANAAFATCFNMGGYLININSELENNYTMSTLASKTAFDGYWTGGFYNGKYWVWQKTNRTGNSVITFMNPADKHYEWARYQPDDALIGRVPQHYVAIMVRYRPRPYKWYSENEFLITPNGMSYICEADWIE